MNATTARCTTPSETKRTGRSGCAPFASLPTSIADDPTIPPLDKAILLVLAGHAWGGKDVCWPSNATIAAKVGCSPAHVKRRLKAIESRGLIDREPSPLNRTGRRFRLLWRDPPVVPAPPLPGSRARPESEASEGKKKERPESDSGQEGPPPPAVKKGGDPPASADELAQLEQWAAGSDPVLAKFGRAALKLAGVVDPIVVDAPHEPELVAEPVVAWVSPEISPAIDQLIPSPLPAVEPPVIVPGPASVLAPGSAQTTSAPGEVTVAGEPVAVVTDGVVVEPVGVSVPPAVVVVEAAETVMEAVVEPTVPPTVPPAVVSAKPAVIAAEMAAVAVTAAMSPIAGLGRGGRKCQETADRQDAERRSQSPSHGCTFVSREPKPSSFKRLPSPVLAPLMR